MCSSSLDDGEDEADGGTSRDLSKSARVKKVDETSRWIFETAEENDEVRRAGGEGLREKFRCSACSILACCRIPSSHYPDVRYVPTKLLYHSETLYRYESASRREKREPYDGNPKDVIARISSPDEKNFSIRIVEHNRLKAAADRTV